MQTSMGGGGDIRNKKKIGVGPIIAATIIKRVHNKDVVYFFQSHNKGYQIITKLYFIYIHNRKSWTWPIYLFCEMYVSLWYWNIKIERY